MVLRNSNLETYNDDPCSGVKNEKTSNSRPKCAWLYNKHYGHLCRIK